MGNEKKNDTEDDARLGEKGIRACFPSLDESEKKSGNDEESRLAW